MMAGVLAIAPIFALIVLGHLLRRGGIPSLEFWNLNDRLVYWVLFPALLFWKMATMELSGELLGGLAVAVYAGFGAALLFGLGAGALLVPDRPLASSLMQGSARHNTFIALAVVEELFGVPELAVATLVTALLIPVTNVSVVSLMVLMLRGPSGGAVVGTIARDLARNPLLLAVGAGLAVNLSGVEHVPVLYDICILLGGAALPIVLMCVGANIRVRAMSASWRATALSMVAKMVVFPVVAGTVATAVGLDPGTVLVVVTFGAVPTAAGAYTLARQMGGDASAMATIVTLQTAVSFVTLPLTLVLAGRWLGVPMG